MSQPASRSSSVSRRNRSRTTLPPSVPSPPPSARVKRGARLRARPSLLLQQPYQQRRHTWQTESCEGFPSLGAQPELLGGSDFPSPSSTLRQPSQRRPVLTTQQPEGFLFESPFVASPPPINQTFSPLIEDGTSSYNFVPASPDGNAAATAFSASEVGDHHSFGDDYSWNTPRGAELEQAQQAQELQDMSALGFMLPAHFPLLEPYQSTVDSSNILMDSPNSHYVPSTATTTTAANSNTNTSANNNTNTTNTNTITNSRSRQMLPTPTSAPSSAYLSSFPSSPALLGNPSSIGERRQSSSSRPEHPGLPYHQRSPYQPAQPSPYQASMASPYQPSQSTLKTSPAPPTYAQTSSETNALMSPPTQQTGYIPSNLTAQGLSSLNYGASFSPSPPQYAPHAYDIHSYHGAPPSMYPQATASTYASHYVQALPDNAASAHSTTSATTPDGRNVRVLNQRPKPQCWEHGCNGRQFSTFSNLLRHQREKSGTAGKSYCPRCGAEFTRTTAMKGHMNNDKCKPRRASGASDPGSG